MDAFESSGGTLNEYFYASLISACGACQPPDCRRAERAFMELLEHGLSPTSVKRALKGVVGPERTNRLMTQARKHLAKASPKNVKGDKPSQAMPAGCQMP